MNHGGSRPGAGRKKGSKGKAAAEIREALTAALSGEIEQIPAYLEAITDPEKKLLILAKFLPYIAPRLQTVQAEIEAEMKPQTIDFSSFEDSLEMLDAGLLAEMLEKAQAAQGPP